MSAEAREKARKHGQKSGKGSQLLSKLIGRIPHTSDQPDE